MVKDNNCEIKLLFISEVPITDFIKSDLDLLKRNFDIRVVHFVYNKKNLKATLGTFLGMIKGVLWADVTFSWFADTHAFWAVKLSKIFRKNSVVIVGGYEVARVPEINYGEMLNSKSIRIVSYVLNNANVIITVDEGLKLDAIRNTGIIGENIMTIPTGYDYEKFKPNGEKENLIITVAAGVYWERARLKGIDIFAESAKFLPDLKFLVIGIEGKALKKLKNISPPNVEFIIQLPQEKIIPYYQRAKVYCQLSMREGLPNALCEAMLCECVPVGSEVQGVKTAIGDAGFLVPYGDAEATSEAIKKALISDKGKEARERIKKMFPLENREKKLKEVIEELVLNNRVLNK